MLRYHSVVELAQVTFNVTPHSNGSRDRREVRDATRLSVNLCRGVFAGGSARPSTSVLRRACAASLYMLSSCESASSNAASHVAFAASNRSACQVDCGGSTSCSCAQEKARSLDCHRCCGCTHVSSPLDDHVTWSYRNETRQTPRLPGHSRVIVWSARQLAANGSSLLAERQIIRIGARLLSHYTGSASVATTWPATNSRSLCIRIYKS